MGTMDPKELAEGDGADGRPGLVAVDGKVYDVSASPLWAGGRHMNAHGAGRDLSLELRAAPHGPEVLERVRSVGELAERPPESATHPTIVPQPTGAIAWVLAQHPHPVSVHFPIALHVAAALFLAGSLVLGSAVLERAALYNLGLALLAAPGAIGAGLLSWRYNYGGIWTPIFRRKLALSFLLLGLGAAALALRLGIVGLDGARTGAPWWGYVALVLAAAPAVLGLGFLGGKITFPR